MFGVHLVMPRTMIDLINCWLGALGCCRHAKIWKIFPHFLMWCIWRECNLRTFEGKEVSSLDLQYLFYRLLFDWIQVIGAFPFSSFQDFIDSCSSYALLHQYISSILDSSFLINQIFKKKKHNEFTYKYMSHSFSLNLIIDE